MSSLQTKAIIEELKGFLDESLARHFSELKESLAPKEELAFIRLSEAMKMLGAGRATFDRWQNPKSEYYIPNFPRKIRMGGYVFYERNEIQAFMQARLEQREQGGEQC